jgi:hypothetical protein
MVRVLAGRPDDQRFGLPKRFEPLRNNRFEIYKFRSGCNHMQRFEILAIDGRRRKQRTAAPFKASRGGKDLTLILSKDTVTAFLSQEGNATTRKRDKKRSNRQNQQQRAGDNINCIHQYKYPQPTNLIIP